jgi:hypothetical protein
MRPDATITPPRDRPFPTASVSPRRRRPPCSATLDRLPRCLARGEDWVELWLCLSCGWVACSNDSPNQNAMAHYEETDHPIAAPLRRGSRLRGATSITARSDSCEWLRLVACLAWDGVAGLLATHRGSPVRLRLTGDKPELPHQPADQLRADLPAGADERDVLAPEPVGAVGVVEQLWLRGGRWQLEVEERANSGAVPLPTGVPPGRFPARWTGTRRDTTPSKRQSGGGAKAQSGPVGQPGHPLGPKDRRQRLKDVRDPAGRHDGDPVGIDAAQRCDVQGPPPAQAR